MIAAAGGEEGLRKVNEEEPDAVLLDVMMPDIDGFEVCRRIRQSHTLDVNLTDRPLEVMLDPLEFGRALLNMVSDAADTVSATTGKIAVRTRRRIHTPSEEDDSTAAQWCVIQISDNGCGEGREHLTRLLTAKSATGSSDLGLALVQNFAASHGGFVSLSAPVEGRGATLAMEIPCLPLNEGHDQ